MNRRFHWSSFLFLLAGLCVSVYVTGNEPPPAGSDPSPRQSSKLTSDGRVQLIRGLQSEHAFVKTPFPQGKKGLRLKDGKVTPDPTRLQQMIALEGAAAKAGERVEITSFEIKGDSMIFEINGGPRKGPKWYNRISVAGMGGETQVRPQDPRTANARGSVLTLEFGRAIPNLTVAEVKQILAPVFDFTPMSQAEAYQSTLPKIVQDAIKNHRVLVGMDREMVVYAVGRPEKKYRDKDDAGTDYEEWIYGTPPAEVQFVRFVGNEVARLEIMKVDGEKIVKTQREFQMAVKEQQQETPPERQGPGKKPTLLGPDEQPADKTTPPQAPSRTASKDSASSQPQKSDDSESNPVAPGNEPVTPAPR